MALTSPAIARQLLELVRQRDGDDTPITDDEVWNAIRACLNSGEKSKPKSLQTRDLKNG